MNENGLLSEIFETRYFYTTRCSLLVFSGKIAFQTQTKKYYHNIRTEMFSPYHNLLPSTLTWTLFLNFLAAATGDLHRFLNWIITLLEAYIFKC